MYEFYRKWISIGFFDRLTRELIPMARDSQGKSSQPTVAVIDSQSVRSGLTQSEKGINGGKKIKGIKWDLAVDSNGFPITIASTNRHAFASACFGHNAAALLPLCANTSARRLTDPALTNIGELCLICKAGMDDVYKDRL